MGLLTRVGETNQKPIESLLSTVKSFHGMLPGQLFDDENRHRSDSKMLGSLKSRSTCGKERGGASNAVTNAAHCSAFNPKWRRSVRVSSARARALSNTKSLTERCAAAAAV